MSEFDLEKVKKYTSSFDDYLEEKLKDPKFKKEFEIASRRWDLSLEIVKARKKAKLTQKQLAKELNTSQSFIARAENACQNVTLDVLMRIADVLSNKIGKPVKFQVKGMVR